MQAVKIAEPWPDRPEQETTDAGKNILLPSFQAGIYVRYGDIPDSCLQPAGAGGWFLHIGSGRRQHRRRQSLLRITASIFRMEKSDRGLRLHRFRSLSPPLLHRPASDEATRG